MNPDSAVRLRDATAVSLASNCVLLRSVGIAIASRIGELQIVN